MTDDKLIAAKQADNFTTESPIRAFTDFQVSGTIAIGKGFRPSLAHLARYLDAMESKEGWRFVQIVLPQDDKGDPTIIFHRERTVAMTVPDLAFDPRAVERIVHPAAPVSIAVKPDYEEKTHWGETKWAEPMEDLVGRMRTAANRKEARSFMLDEKVQNIGHWQSSASIASRRRAEERFPAPRKVGGGPVKHIGALVEAQHPSGHNVIFGNPGNRYDDMGAPHDTRLTVRVRSSVGNVHEFPAIFKSEDGWHLVTAAKKAKILGTTALRGRPVAWRLDDDQPWTPADDDPVNPKHYGGTACAEIGELLSANSYQVLKYNWRLGEKDDPVVELGKSLWYLDRELALIAEGHTGRRDLPDHGFFDSRLAHGSDHAQAVARILISWNRHHNAHSLYGLRKLLNKKLEELKAVPAPRKVGGGPVVPAWMEHASDAPIPDDHYVQAAEYVIRRIFTARNQADRIDGAIRDFTKRFAPPKNHNCTSHVGLFRQLEFVLHGVVVPLRLKQLIDAYRQEQKLHLCDPDLGRGVEP